jgi:hypothetical protein
MQSQVFPNPVSLSSTGVSVISLAPHSQAGLNGLGGDFGIVDCHSVGAIVLHSMRAALGGSVPAAPHRSQSCNFQAVHWRGSLRADRPNGAKVQAIR